MKMIVAVALALVAVAAAAPAPGELPVPQTLRSHNDQNAEGYAYGFETDNGITIDANGELKTITGEDNKPQTVVVVRGTYSYTGADGKPILITYYADENGYHAEGDAVPKLATR